MAAEMSMTAEELAELRSLYAMNVPSRDATLERVMRRMLATIDTLRADLARAIGERDAYSTEHANMCGELVTVENERDAALASAQGLQAKLADTHAAWMTANAEANDHYARVCELEASAQGMRAVLETIAKSGDANLVRAGVGHIPDWVAREWIVAVDAALATPPSAAANEWDNYRTALDAARQGHSINGPSAAGPADSAPAGATGEDCAGSTARSPMSSSHPAPLRPR